MSKNNTAETAAPPERMAIRIKVAFAYFIDFYRLHMHTKYLCFIVTDLLKVATLLEEPFRKKVVLSFFMK